MQIVKFQESLYFITWRS